MNPKLDLRRLENQAIDNFKFQASLVISTALLSEEYTSLEF